MTTATLDAPVETQAPAAPTKTERSPRPSIRVTGSELLAMKRGVDYTGKLEIVGKGTFVWHRDAPSELSQARATVAEALRAGATVFDVTGGLDHATKVRDVTPDMDELLGVAPIAGG